MSRLIDADALLRDIEHYHLSDGKFQHWVEIQPTIERKTGKWIHTDTQAGYGINGDLVWADMMKCETCGFEIDVIQGHIAQYNFCPNCGADTRETP